MSYLAVLTFDLHSADSEDYECATKQLAAIGFLKQLKGQKGPQDLPFNTYAGTFNGSGAVEVWNALIVKVKQALQRCNLHGKLFLEVAGDWAWGTDAF
jgi:hypothetical protein